MIPTRFQREGKCKTKSGFPGSDPIFVFALAFDNVWHLITHAHFFHSE